MENPKTDRIDVFETLHGKKLNDPYRWLEDFNDGRVQKWLDSQHEFTENVLNQIPNREEAINRIATLLSIGEITVPVKKKDVILFEERITENQPILYIQFENAEKRILINLNEFNKNEPTALDWYFISPQANLLAYGLSRNGDEWSILHLMNIETGEILNDRIPRTRHCNLAWLSDESGFYYTRFPEPGSVPEGEENYNSKIYLHKIGSNWKDDELIFGEGLDPTYHYGVSISSDDKYLLVSIMKYTKNDLLLLDLQNNNKISEIIVDQDVLTSAGILDDTLWLLSNRNHPNKAIYKTNLNNPNYKNWELIIPEKEDEIIGNVIVTPECVFCKVMINASDYVKVYTIDGQYHSQIELPDYSSIFGFTEIGLVTRDDNEFYFGLRSFLYPTNIYKYTITSQSLSLFKQIAPPIKPEDYVVKQVWYESKDKTKVSMFITHKKDIILNGLNPTLLCGYGGFNIAIQPPYLKTSRFYWLERGGIIAIANIRGGSEYGEIWHRDGMLNKKQNVFDDFIYAAKWLIQNNYTSKEHLGIFGRSNGGLLTGAAVTQAPELFNAVYICVPLLDMLRYHLFRIARYWIPEYGSSENPEQFEFLSKYSPYHNVKKNTSYPATFLVTAASDSRVDSSHAMKMAAKMQWATSSQEPIILFVEGQAGHGVGKPLYKLAKTEADFYTFIGWKTGLKL